MNYFNPDMIDKNKIEEFTVEYSLAKKLMSPYYKISKIAYDVINRKICFELMDFNGDIKAVDVYCTPKEYADMFNLLVKVGRI